MFPNYITPILFVLVGAIGNRYAGWKNGDRYIPTAAMAFLLGLFYGIPAVSIAAGFLVWRSIGWQDTLDMGRDAGSFIGDSLLFYFIAYAFGIIPTLVYHDLRFIPATATAVTLIYAASFWLLPYRKGIPHVAIAEVLSGAALGWLSWKLVTHA
jgi:dolichyl-phosphate-mannose--protein O-mannosyl transferase